MIRNKIFYSIKHLIPRRLQISLRRQIAKRKRQRFTHTWPIDPSAAEPPKGWKGWPDGKNFALVLTHDVDTQRGHDRCYDLLDIEEDMGFRSSFNFVPERYRVSEKLIERIKSRGFEVGVHGLKHDGKLYASKEIFAKRARKINFYLKKWEAVGFRSPAMHHNLEWIHLLNIRYDASTFDTDPFEPQSDAVATIYPFWVANHEPSAGYLELPYTLPQDFTLFIIMGETSPKIWRQKADWIAEKKGMVLLNTHPDYINFSNKKAGYEEYPVKYYIEFLNYIKSEYGNEYWNPLAKEINTEHKNL